MRPSSHLAPVVVFALFALGALGCGAPPGSAPGAESVAPSEEPRLVLLYATCTLDRRFLTPYVGGNGSGIVPSASEEPDGSAPVSALAPALTPAIDALARRGTLFPRHLSESGQSGTAFAALFTGLHADGHGVYRHPTPLDPSVGTIFEHFRAAGWHTLAWLDHGMASNELDYSRGADGAFDRRLNAGDPEFLEVLERLRRDPDYRALVVTNFTVTHGPYQRGPVDAFCRRFESVPGVCEARDRDPEAFERYVALYQRAHAHLSYDFPATRERMAMGDEHLEELQSVVELLYRANVAYLDHLFGQVVGAVEAAGLGESSVVAFTADHGETLFRDDTLFKWTHGHQLAQEVLTVPWIVAGPGVSTGTYPQPTRSVDVYPTLAGLAGLGSPDLDGRSVVTGVDLSGVLSGAEVAPRLDAFSHTSLVAEPVIESARKWGLFHSYFPRVDPRLMWAQLVRGDRLYQVRRGPAGSEGPGPASTAVFDLAVDPLAERPLEAGGVPAGVDANRQAFRALDLYRRALIEGWSRWAERSDDLDAARQEELLRSLGYVAD